MKAEKKLSIALAALMVAGALPVAVAADDTTEMVYGTMTIPYAEFYRGEGVDYDVDVVTSATASKWKNENLVGGTYSHEAEKGGVIDGVVYPVAVPKDAVASIDEKYSFTETDSVPEAYKTVSVVDGEVIFSAVEGASEDVDNIVLTLRDSSRYGDYQIDAKGLDNANGKSSLGTIYGVLLKTTDGGVYAMRHLENIWRDKIAWSSGFNTKEVHGNALAYENYATLPGKTISEIVYITETGYHTVKADIYVPEKFENTLAVADADITAGKTAVTMTGFPEDYDSEYSVDGLEASVADGVLSYTNAAPGAYTLTVTDKGGKYASVSASFTLTTDNMPAEFDGEKIVTAKGADAADFAEFLSKIATVTVDETSYAASGKRAVKIVGSDGRLDLTAKKGENAIFADGTHTVTVTATGYTQTVTFEINVNNGEIAVKKSYPGIIDILLVGMLGM